MNITLSVLSSLIAIIFGSMFINGLRSIDNNQVESFWSIFISSFFVNLFIFAVLLGIAYIIYRVIHALLTWFTKPRLKEIRERYITAATTL